MNNPKVQAGDTIEDPLNRLQHLAASLPAHKPKVRMYKDGSVRVFWGKGLYVAYATFDRALVDLTLEAEIQAFQVKRARDTQP